MIQENSWRPCKCNRAKEVGWVCEECGASRESGATIVGHHIVPKSSAGQNSSNNCRLRCDLCEQAAHIFSSDGNPAEWKMEAYIATRREYQKQLGRRINGRDNSQLCKDLRIAWRRGAREDLDVVALYA